MRHVTIYLALFIFIVFSACDKVDEFTQFTMDYRTEVTIQSSIGVDVPVTLMTPDIQSNAESEFAVNDTRKDLVEEIRLQESVLTITQPDDGDFSFLKSIHLYIHAEGLENQLIASKENIPEEVGAVLELEINDVDLQSYIKKDEFTLQMETVTDEIISRDHVIELYSEFWVDAKVLGQ